MPGAIIAMGRLNRPSILVYGGTIQPGCLNDRKLDIVSAFEALGQKVAGDIGEREFQSIIENACPGPGACGGMYTANTMASAIEAMGMSLPYSSSNPAVSKEKRNELKLLGKSMMTILKREICPRDIMTKAAFENAIRLIILLGGSTNGVMHLIAMAQSVGVRLSLKDFTRLGKKTPFIADLKPSGVHVMEDLHKVGGIPAVMKMMLEEGLLHGDCMTVTGKTIRENLKKVKSLKRGQQVIRPLSEPIKKTSHLHILYGNLAPEGSVAKITGKEGLHFKGTAKVYNSEAKANAAIQAGKIKKGDVIVIRYVGPKGGPGMPEMLKPTSLVMGAGLGKEVALITDGRFSGGTHGFVVGHITPEAFEGGLIAILKNGDSISIDAKKNKIEVLLSKKEISSRLKRLRHPKKKVQGVLKKYRYTVSSASEGCVTDKF